MSTRAVIARKTARGWSGRYHHCDGYPTGLGAELWRQLRENFKGDLRAMLKILIDEHPAGWDSILGHDLSIQPGFTEDRHLLKRGGMVRKRWGGIRERIVRAQCFCHGDRNEEGWTITKSMPCSDREWGYVLDESARTMTVLFATGGKANWFDCGTLALDGQEPDWEDVEYLPCRTNPEKLCKHYRWVHDPTLCRDCDGTRIEARSGHSVGFNIACSADCVPVEHLREPVRSIYFSLPNTTKENWHCFRPRMCETCGGTGRVQVA